MVWFVFGLVAGAGITVMLVQSQQRLLHNTVPSGYFRQLLLSICVSSLSASSLWLAFDLLTLQSIQTRSLLFGFAWLCGGLLASLWLWRRLSRS